MIAIELRVGNFLNYQKNKSIFQGKVTCITRYKVTLDERDSFKLLTGEKDSLIPIPLHLGWMEQFGFKWIGNPNKTNSLVVTHHSKPNIEIIYSDDHGFNLRDINVKIEYVHQLQNLWYDLTKFELVKLFENNKLCQA